jgi:hypothetical protein
MRSIERGISERGACKRDDGQFCSIGDYCGCNTVLICLDSLMHGRIKSPCTYGSVLDDATSFFPGLLIDYIVALCIKEMPTNSQAKENIRSMHPFSCMFHTQNENKIANTWIGTDLQEPSRHSCPQQGCWIIRCSHAM